MSKTKNLDKTIIVTGNKLAIVGDAERRVRLVKISNIRLNSELIDRQGFDQDGFYVPAVGTGKTNGDE